MTRTTYAVLAILALPLEALAVPKYLAVLHTGRKGSFSSNLAGYWSRVMSKTGSRTYGYGRVSTAKQVNAKTTRPCGVHGLQQFLH